MDKSPQHSHEVNDSWALFQRHLRRFFTKIWVEVVIAVLVVISVVLTLTEVALEASSQEVPTSIAQIRWLNVFHTALLSIELTLRFFAARSKRNFLRMFWIDILAVLPLFQVFRSVLPLKLLRLFRVLRLIGVATRLTTNYPYIFRRGAIEYLFVCGMIAMTVVFGTVAVTYFENRNRPVDQETVGKGQLEVLVDEAEADPPQTEFNLEHSFWFSVYSLFAGEPIPHAPRTIGGRVVSVFIMFMGLTIFAMFTGTVSAFMVDRFRTEGRVIDVNDLDDHIVICGWNSKAEIIVEEYRASKLTKSAPIIVITESEPDSATITEYMKKDVSFLTDDFTKISALETAGIAKATTCILLSDTFGGRSEQDADARTILAALTVEKINPEIYTCAELLQRSYGSHLEMGHVNDYVVSGEHSAYMLAQSAMNRGLMGILDELLTYQRGNEFYRQELLPDWVGMSFQQLLAELKEKHNAILVAVYPVDGSMIINPTSHSFREGDEIVIIASGEIG